MGGTQADIRPSLRQSGTGTRLFWPYLCLFALLMALHLCIRDPRSGEDGYYYTVGLGQLPAFLSWRYANGTSRVLIEAVTVLLAQLPFACWMVLNCGVLTVAARAMQGLAASRTAYGASLACLCVLLFDMSMLHKTGWLVASLNDLWPCALALHGLRGLRTARRPQKWYQYLGYILAMVYAASAELWAAVLCAFALLAMTEARANHRCNTFVKFTLILMALALAVAILCPGNHSRYAQELRSGFENFNMYTLWDKLLLGVLSTFASAVYTGGWPLWTLCLVLPWAMMRRDKSTSMKVRAFVPMITLVLAQPGLPRHEGSLSNAGLWPANLPAKLYACQFRDGIELWSLEAISLAVIAGLVCACLCTAAARLTLGLKKSRLSLALPAGIVLRLVICFSPAMYSYGNRALLPLSFACMAVLVRVLLTSRRWGGWQLSTAGLAVAAAAAFVQNLMGFTI